jgi:hypothetical protein
MPQQLPLSEVSPLAFFINTNLQRSAERNDDNFLYASFLKASFVSEIVRISRLKSQAAAQNANKKIIQLTLPCLQDARRN